MQRDLLDRLLRIQAAKRPAALVTDLASGDQALVEAGSAVGALALGEAEVAGVLSALRDDRSALDPILDRTGCLAVLRG